MTTATSGLLTAILRRLLIVDASFEVLLGAALITAPWTGLQGWLDLPAPLDETWTLLAAGAGLFVAAAVIGQWAQTLQDWQVIGLSLLNDATASILIAWVFLADAFTTAGMVAVLGIAGLLAVLSSAQVVTWALRKQALMA